MKFINDKLIELKEDNDILAKSAYVKERKLTHPELIDATIGTMYDEDGKVAVLNTYKKVAAILPDDMKFTYAATGGNAIFHSALLNKLFTSYDKNCVRILPTPGATGAINATITMSCKENDVILIPEICWGVYKLLGKAKNLKQISYNYLKDNHFDLEDLKNKIDSIKQDNLTIILNDPCNNPTSYSLTFAELKALREMLANSHKNITLIYDVAYYAYSVNGVEDYQDKFDYLFNFSNNVLVIMAWSASKAFTIYGLRFGSMVIIHHDKEILDNYYSRASLIARSTWSSANHAAMETITTILINRKLNEKLDAEIESYTKMLEARAKLFSKEADEVHLDYIPYNGGFFMAVKSDNPKELVAKLEQKEIYVMAFNKVIRIAICSLPLNKIKGLAKIIHDLL